MVQCIGRTIPICRGSSEKRVMFIGTGLDYCFGIFVYYLLIFYLNCMDLEKDNQTDELQSINNSLLFVLTLLKAAAESHILELTIKPIQ